MLIHALILGDPEATNQGEVWDVLDRFKDMLERNGHHLFLVLTPDCVGTTYFAHQWADARNLHRVNFPPSRGNRKKDNPKPGEERDLMLGAFFEVHCILTFGKHDAQVARVVSNAEPRPHVISAAGIDKAMLPWSDDDEDEDLI